MNINVSKKDLLRLVSRVQGASAKLATVPGLNSVLLSASKKEIRASATDLYVSLTGAVSCDVKKQGSVALPAKDLIARIKAMPDGDITVSATEAGTVTIKAHGSPRKFTIHGMPGSDFPAMRSPSDSSKASSIAASTIAQVLSLTAFSIQQDETRPATNSLSIAWSNGSIVAASTDGHRLSRACVQVDASDDCDRLNCLLPLRAVTQLRSMVDAGDSIATVTQDGTWVYVEVDGIVLGASTCDGAFLPVEQVIPKSSSASVSVPREQFAESLRAVAVSASERTGGVKLSLSDGQLRIIGESADSGNGYDEIAVDYNAAKVELGVNSTYIIQALDALECDSAILGMSGDRDPITIRPDGDGTEFVGVIMPMVI